MRLVTNTVDRWIGLLYLLAVVFLPRDMFAADTQFPSYYRDGGKAVCNPVEPSERAPRAEIHWVLKETLVNPNNEPVEFYGGPNGTPYWYNDLA